MRENRLIRIVSNILVFLVLAATTSLLVRPLQKNLFAKMTALRNDLLGRGEAFLGMRIEYASMSPSVFSTLDIRDIRIYGSTPEPLVSLGRLRISLSLAGILRGDGVDAIRLIRLDKPVLSLDIDHAGDWDALFAKAGEHGENPGAAPDESLGDWLAGFSGNFALKIRGGGCHVRAGGNKFFLAGLNLDTVVRGSRVLLKGRAEGEAFFETFLGRSRTMGLNGRFSGELDTRLREGKLAIALPSFYGDGFSFRTLKFDVAIDPEKIEVQKTEDGFTGEPHSFDLSLGYVFGMGRFFGRFEGRDFSPRFLLSLSGPWKEYNSFLGLSVNGSVSFETAPGGVSYSLDLSGDMGDLFPIDGVAYAIAATGNLEYVRFRRLGLTFPRGDIQYAGGLSFKNLSPNGMVSIRDLSLVPGIDSRYPDGGGDEYVINADLTVSSYGRTVAIFGDSVSMGPVLFTALDAGIQRENSGFTFDFSALRMSPGIESSGDVRISRFSAEGSFDYEPRYFQAGLIFDAFSVDDLLRMLRPLAIIPSLPETASLVTAKTSITTEIFVTTDFDQIFYNAPRFVLVYHNGQNEIVALSSISGTNKRFELNESNIIMTGAAAAGSGYELSGYLDFYNPNDVNFSLAASYKDMSYYIEGALLDQRSLSIQGSYGLLVYMSRTAEGGYSGYAEAASIPISFRSQFFRLGFFSSLRYDSTKSWSMDMIRLEISELATPASSSASLRFAGRVDQNGASFQDIVFDDGRGELFGRAFLSWSGNTDMESKIPETLEISTSGIPETDPADAAPALSTIDFFLRLEDRQDSEIYNFEGKYENSLLEMRLLGREMQLGRVLASAPNALAAGEGLLRWTPGGPYEITATLSSLTARYNENIIVLSSQGSLRKDEIELRNLRVSYGNIEAEIPLFRLNRRDSGVWAQGQFRGIAAGRRVEGAFTSEVDFEPFESWLVMRKALNSFSGILNVEQFRLDNLDAADPFRLVFSRNESLISLSGGPRDMLRFRITGDGSFYAGLSYPFPIRGAVTGTITANTIDAKAANLYIDLTVLGRLLPHKEKVALTGGVVNASVDIKGPLSDPEFFGTAQGNSVRLEIPQYLGAELGPVPLMIIFDGNEMSFGPVNVPAGNGAGMVSGWFRFDRWVPDTFSIDINSSQEYPVPFDFEILGIRARGDASGFMNVSLQDSRLFLSGELLGEDMEIILDNQGITAAMNQPVSNDMGIIADFTLTTGRKVEFFWPTADYPLLQASAMAGLEIKIASDSDSGRFSITGDIGLRSGSVYYGQRNFYIREGSLIFNENEIQFDPRITVRAETRDRSDDGPVTISMIVDDAPLVNFTARFESNPALSQIEILSLIGQNLTGLPLAGEEETRIQNIMFSGVDFLSQSIVFRRLERIIRGFTRLDMFTFHSPIVQNFISSRWNPIDNEGRGNYFDNTAVFIGKYFSSDMFFQGSVFLQYDENKLDMGGYTFETNLGIEVRSPLFDIHWDIAPLKYETFFDASLTLMWRWLF
ncbi:MAG: translocation/assembly module TamB [Treponema sp.]|jgi:hypothetical protein|nr:translocation/assembly module TamB [Treponema sp.]